MMSSSDADDNNAFAEVANKADEVGFEVNISAIDAYQDINYWVSDDGLIEKQVMSQLEELAKVGSVKEDSKPAYDQKRDSRVASQVWVCWF